MEFNLNLKDYFRKSISKVDNRLVPEGIYHDRHIRTCIQAISEIIDQMGIASAKAQGLLKPITTTDKLRNSEHTVYIYIDPDGNNGKGVVIGILKVGRKRLFVFDKSGECYDNVALCVLDFYVHESRQRLGCGKLLFEHMLKEENVMPEKLAIDKPSDKFLSFLTKHYGLSEIVPQTNNFVVYDGYFPSPTLSVQDDFYSRRRSGAWSSPSNLSSPIYIGRHAAQKPETTIGQIIHSSPVL